MFINTESLYSKQDIKLSQEKICDVAAVGAHCCEFLGDALEWFGGNVLCLDNPKAKRSGICHLSSPSSLDLSHVLLR